jgi:glycosyltransferase involved in cell wall biosynthesis
MILTRDPSVEASGRAELLRQRIDQMHRIYTLTIVVIGKAGARGEFELLGWPCAFSIIANAWRLRSKPVQTWLYFSRRIRSRIVELVQASGARTIYVDMVRLAPLVVELRQQACLIVDYDDLLSIRYARAAPSGHEYEVLGYMAKSLPLIAALAKTFARLLLRSESRRLKGFELALLNCVDLALFSSPREADIMAMRARTSGSRHLPAIAGIPPVVRSRGAVNTIPGQRLYLLGNFNYAENIIALRALAKAVQELDAAGEMRPDIMIELIGDYPKGLSDEVNPAHFSFLGRLPNLSTIAGKGIFLAPVQTGSGVSMKVLEGMALGCPVVTTPRGCDGLSATANRHLLVCPDAAKVLRVALKLRQRPGLRSILARRAYAYLERFHSEAITDRFCTLVRDAEHRAAIRIGGWKARSPRSPPTAGGGDPHDSCG